MAEENLRILMVAPTPFFADRGCHVRIYEEALALRRLGHEVRIATYHLGRDMPDVTVARTPQIRWYGKLEAGPSWHKPYLDLLLLWRTLAVGRSFRPHLIHGHLHEGALIGAAVARLLRIPLLFDYQGSMVAESLNHGFMQKDSLLASSFAWLERFINRRADLVITSSGHGRNELLREWGADPDKVVTFMDGVDTDLFKPYPKGEARRLLGIPEDAEVVVYLGLLNSYQGIDLLLDAIRIVRDNRPGIRFLLMGFPEQEYIRKSVDMGIDDVITFTGLVNYDAAAQLLSAGDLAVSPKLSRTEANGKLFNYMACGLPTVVFDNPVNREILGEDGIFVDRCNPSSLAGVMIAALDNPERMNSLSGTLRQRAEQQHSWKSRGRYLDSLYRDLLFQAKAKKKAEKR